jgi:hypothetical protein
MRYMRGLNEWLERDVHDRQAELRGVVARVDQLREDMRAIPRQGVFSVITFKLRHNSFQQVRQRLRTAAVDRARRKEVPTALYRRSQAGPSFRPRRGFLDSNLKVLGPPSFRRSFRTKADIRL